MKNIYTIKKAIYRSFAEQIAQAVGRGCYLSGVFSCAEGDVVHKLELSIVIYRDKASGEIIEVSDVWWDSYTIERTVDGEPVLKINDFDFIMLKRELLGK